ncbi:limbic system-associated membrane isoform X1 [Brachionus plicatilis]|uniref:Limbic system-associated membrane isoform X1 n=1 Tax=Brachionus plicatilis TaxID=10195 RepID=A0A3M7RA18_BRAPC|nr:limbic system-associated membrane isoform X1 [Brachionus plicatilis]
MLEYKKILVIFLLIFVQCSQQKRHRVAHRLKYAGLNNHKRTLENEQAKPQRDYVSAVVGKDVQLDCKMNGLVGEDEKIVWLRMPKGEVLALNSNRVSSDARIGTKCSSNMAPCWSLVITSVQESDTGFYVCQTNAMQNKYVYLDVMVPPMLMTQYPLERIDVNHSSHFTLTCEFYGKPEPLIKWYKYHNGVQKEMEKFRGMNKIDLMIHKDSPNEFECVADNSIPPTVNPPMITFLNGKLFQKLSEQVILDCRISSNPKSEISWFRGETKIVNSNKFIIENLDHSNSRLYINNLAKEDFSDYYCRAENVLGKAVAKSELIELRVISLTDSSRIFTTKSTTSTVIQTEDFNQLVFKSSTELANIFKEFHLPTTNDRVRSSKNPLHRSNQFNHSRMLSNIYSSHKVLNYPKNFISTTRYLELENRCHFLQPNAIYLYIFWVKSKCLAHRLNRAYLIFLIIYIGIFSFESNAVLPAAMDEEFRG